MSQNIMIMGMQGYDTTTYPWSLNQGSDSWWHSQDKGGLITSHPSHPCEMFVYNTVTSGHQDRIVSLISSLEA
jgi:hypothetical protein